MGDLTLKTEAPLVSYSNGLGIKINDYDMLS